MNTRDLEQMCERNHNRAKWAEEVSRAETYKAMRMEHRKKKLRVLRTASLASAMICGLSAAFVGIGVVSMHIPTIILASVVCLVFLVSGFSLEWSAEEVEGLA